MEIVEGRAETRDVQAGRALPQSEAGDHGTAATAGAYLVANARVWGNADVDSILIVGNRIAAIGRGLAPDVDGVERVDARGASVLPGFVDAHTHLVQTGLAESGWETDLAGCSRGEALERLAEGARRRAAGEWLVASGWDESRWSPSVALSRVDLDRISSRVPTIAVRVDGHVAVMNSAAIERARRSAEGRPRPADWKAGEVRERGVERVLALARPDASSIRDALRAAAVACHRRGITTAHVFSGWLEPTVLLEEAQRLLLRLVVHPPIERLRSLVERGVETGRGNDWARWGGVKLFADGSVGARNAAVTTRYVSGGRGALNLRSGALRTALVAADRAGLQTLVHAIGDRAIAQVLRAHREAGTDRGLRHRIEHFEFPAVHQIETTLALGLCVCMQPNFVGNWSGPGRLYEAALGAGSDAACNPLRAVLDAQIPLGLGSDGMPLSPLYGIASAVEPRHPGQRMSLGEAVDGYTLGSAGLTRGEPGTGLLAVGRRADLVVLDRPLDPTSVAAARVAATFVDGELVYVGAP